MGTDSHQGGALGAMKAQGEIQDFPHKPSTRSRSEHRPTGIDLLILTSFTV